MPFGEEFMDEDLGLPLVQSDLIGGSLESESPAEQDFSAGAGPTVVTLDDRAGVSDAAAGVPEADMDIDAEDEVGAISPAPAPPSTKKRGRPSLSGSATPARSVTSKTPRSAKSAAVPKSAGRSTGKRKPSEPESEANESESTPAPKRGRPARSAAAPSARLAAKAAKKPTRGRPKSTTPAAKPAKKGGRPRKETTNGEVPTGEFEVEDIVDSAIDADTMEHMYFVKWKNYPASDNTWEPKKNLTGSLDLVRKFDAKKKKAEAEEAAKKASTKKAAAPASEAEKKVGRGRKAKAVKAVKKAPGRPGRKRRAPV